MVFLQKEKQPYSTEVAALCFLNSQRAHLSLYTPDILMTIGTGSTTFTIKKEKKADSAIRENRASSWPDQGCPARVSSLSPPWRRDGHSLELEAVMGRLQER